MAQRPKEHVREAIVEAGASLFARVGYEATTMGAVAERAGSSIGNVYRYFAGKSELFEAVLPAAFAEELRRLTRQRIEAFGAARDRREIEGGGRYHLLSAELVEHCLAHRDQVVILLARAEGTRFEGFAKDFTKDLVSWALQYARLAYPAIAPSPALRFALGRAYGSFLASLAAALVEIPGAAAAREAIALLTEHHQGGLARLLQSVDDERSQRHEP